MEAPKTEDRLILYKQNFTSRLLLGTGRYDSPSVLADAIRAAAPAMLTAVGTAPGLGIEPFGPIVLELRPGNGAGDSAQHCRMFHRE